MRGPTRLLTGAAVLAIAVGGVALAVRQAPARTVLRAELAALDAQLAARRALEADPAALRAAHAQALAERARWTARFAPPVAVLAAELAPLGVQVTELEGEPLDGCRRQRLRFSAAERGPLAALVERLAEVRPMLRIAHFGVGEDGSFALDGWACAPLPLSAPRSSPAGPAASSPASTWSALLTLDLTRGIAQRRAALGALEARLPLFRETEDLRSEARARNASLDALAASHRGIRAVGAALLAGDPPLLAPGRVDATPDLVVASGRLRGPPDRDAFARAIGPRYRLIRFAPRGDVRGEYELTLLPVE